MRDGDRKKASTGGNTSTQRAISGGGNKMADAASSKLTKIGRVVGNEEIQKRLSQGNAGRDEMLAFISSRLQTVRAVQLREVDQMSHANMRENWKEIADSHKQDVTKPDPKRWGASAAMYEEAMVQLCRGAVGRGADLLERAVAEEKQAFGSLTTLVEVDDLEVEIQSPEVTGDMTENQGSGACEIPPDDARLAHDIQACLLEVTAPPNKKITKKPWWAEEEEEEEEESDDQGE
jgi:hypothetical protein